MVKVRKNMSPEEIQERIKPLTITAISDAIVLQDAYALASGLKPNEGFVQNAWGFPIVPIPSSKKIEGIDTPHLVPDVINLKFFAHPIFWIDESISSPRSTEVDDPTRWAIRMFYTMLGLGLLHPDTYEWYDAPAVKLERYNTDDIRNYREGIPSKLDSVVFTVEDFVPGVTLETIERSVEKALLRILDIQDQQVNKLRVLQTSAFEDAKKILKDDKNWRKITREGQRISWKIRQEAIADRSISGYSDEMFENKEQAVHHLSNMGRIAQILSLRAMQSETYSTTMYAKLVAISESLETTISSGSYSEQLDMLFERMFRGEGGFREDDEEETVYSASLAEYYNDALPRLDLAYSNFVQAAADKSLYNSLDERDLDERLNALGILEGDDN